MPPSSRPTPIKDDAHEALELRRRLYLMSLALVVPAALITIQSAFPHPGFLRYFTLTITAGWVLLFLGLLLRLIGNRVVEWGTYLLGAVVFMGVLLSTLLEWHGSQAMAFLGAASILPAWAFLVFRDRLGLRMSVAYYLLTLATWLVFALPAWLNGTFNTSYLAEAWKTYVYFYALSPVYIILTASMAVLNRHQSRRRLRAVTEYAYQDALTGLPNRRAFQEHLTGAVDHAVQTGESGTLILVNINGFTRLNNELGHTAGDTALRTLAARWQAQTGHERHLSRVSGDEFAVILPPNHADDEPQQIAALLAATTEPVEFDGVYRSLSVRLGLVHFPEHGTTATAINSAADVAQAEARRLGQQVLVYDAGLAARAVRRRSILAALPEATQLGQMHLLYQPIFALQTGEMQSVEALLRWNSPVTPNPTPDEFIAVAEEARMIEPLGEWVMHTALKQMRVWHDSGVRVPRVNVNVAPQELLRAGYADRVLALLWELRLPPSALELELTERTVLEKDAVNELKVLRLAGVNVAIDDFGTGHSSLAWLHALPITCVKLDRRFTGMLGQDGAADRLSRTVLNLANSLNLEVVAEGVETREQMDLLRSLHCPLGQGYLFSKPLPADALEAFLLERHQPWSQMDGAGAQP